MLCQRCVVAMALTASADCSLRGFGVQYSSNGYPDLRASTVSHIGRLNRHVTSCGACTRTSYDTLPETRATRT